MVKILFRLSLLFQIVMATTLFAQIEVEKYHFNYLKEEQLQNALKLTGRDTVKQASGHSDMAKVQLEAVSYYLIHSNINPDPNSKPIDLVLLKDVDGEVKSWQFVHPSLKPYRGKAYFNLNYSESPLLSDSYLFFLEQEPILALKGKYSWHSEFTETFYFYSLKQDTLRYLGKLPILHQGTDTFERMLDEFGREVEQFAIMNGSVLIKCSFSGYYSVGPNYPEEYHLSHKGFVTVEKAKIPQHYISKEEAKKRIDQIFEDYYSNNWKKTAETAAGKRSRAAEFFYRFDRLCVLRSNFAPAYYNKACMSAILEKDEEAIKNLKTALNLDPNYKTKAARDSDFESLRQSPEFQELLK